MSNDPVETVKSELIRLCKEAGINARYVHSFGYKFDSAFWIEVDTDRDRSAIKRNAELMDRLKKVFIDTGYIDHINMLAARLQTDRVSPGIEVESNETVKRDFNGNWWYAMK